VGDDPARKKRVGGSRKRLDGCARDVMPSRANTPLAEQRELPGNPKEIHQSMVPFQRTYRPTSLSHWLTLLKRKQKGLSHHNLQIKRHFINFDSALRSIMTNRRSSRRSSRTRRWRSRRPGAGF
jgi:hypothetical protein